MEKFMNHSGTAVWQFSGQNGQWYNYKPRSCCSVTSIDIERKYKCNRRGSIKFTVQGSPYVLDFNKMTQTCCCTGATRNVRRLVAQKH